MKTSASPKRSLFTLIPPVKYFILTIFFISLSSLCDAENQNKKLLNINELMKGTNDSSRVAKALKTHLTCPEIIVAMEDIPGKKIIGPLFLKETSTEINYFLSTKIQPDPVDITDKKLSSSFDMKHDTIIIIHGFQSNAREKWIMSMKDAFISWKEFNVVMVDWSKYSTTLAYTDAAKKIRKVGKHIGSFLKSIVDVATKSKRSTERWGSIHLIGHSLGAHISAMAARNLTAERTKWTIKRITGLDPAQPCFDNSNLGLTKNDAPFVDVIHTCGEAFDDFGLGLFQRRGHVDFYPNGGKHQPGCDEAYNLNPVTYLLSWGLTSQFTQGVTEAICNHGQSYVYFTESILAQQSDDECTFWGHKWNGSKKNVSIGLSGTCDENKCAKMGILADKGLKNGAFYVEIEKSPPYCYMKPSPRS